MAQKQRPNPIEIHCPCCKAQMTVDPELAVVLSHTPPPRAASGVDLNDAARILADQAAQREAKFQQSWEAEKSKEDVLTRKFEENLKKARQQPVEKPVRDFDLD
jgi:hypothetical protein